MLLAKKATLNPMTEILYKPSIILNGPQYCYLNNQNY